MPHISLEENVPGIRSLVNFRPDTGKPLYELVQVLLRGPSGLSEAERELIAAYVSHVNSCTFCRNSHAAAAACFYGDDSSKVTEVLADLTTASVSPKLNALLQIAGKAAILGTEVQQEDIDKARHEGADDADIHDSILIAATFAMFNRYVDGLASFTPDDPAIYEEMGKRMVKNGYVLPTESKK